MKIINVMFSKVNGGVERVFLNYNELLRMEGNQVIPVIHPHAAIKKECSGKETKKIFSYGRNDLFAVFRLWKLLRKEKPDCIITHTKRAAVLVKKTRTKIPKIAVCHDPQLIPQLELTSDAIIAITNTMQQKIVSSGSCTKKIYTVPNMIEFPKGLTYILPLETEVPVIGTMSRFSDEKGIDVFINALAHLKQRNIPFRAKIAGDGKQRKQYELLIQQHHLESQVSLLGWIDDKEAFYKSLDLFCLPSRIESFGLVVLESMMYSLPMVLANSSGPSDIIGDTNSAIMVPTGDSNALAKGLEQLILDKNLATTISYNAFQRLQDYSFQKIAPVLQAVLVDCTRARN